ncbi:MAG: hypothetical protein EWV75_15855 [Microcystis wesenbergii Mw_QC_S_20081001_S30D]|uniref:Uncharacterized protein n=2 Tax=Microcystis TaxID=1125 RepID=A0A552JFB3_9CHRO|nr:MAG: hypothetical protein EWV81_02005 [Microcystis aeruginosa Ma_SC_T_19800800_S464]TRU94352.1 MAG: hypothetical protein EWV73_22370 [Microcystis wesenbergii Mw_QC_B_20070930_S4D]TRU94429.1 MAG: hypothetical protein EWV75_15855 [Microcystis wesenbergii Mw_QC_S_20081001_S30D]TRU99252.1 MAG: hypothetical protein EWV74_14365 [Microcystis wesenbergii Mw_QC_S_20081001_S30]TRV16185.1 MAG: hypothetical protein EWV89_05855 [Microcystis wesenbergii Mw_QC_B_20070930_S4]
MPSADFFTDVVMLLNIEDRFFNLLQEIITIIVCWVSFLNPTYRLQIFPRELSWLTFIFPNKTGN